MKHFKSMKHLVSQFSGLWLLSIVVVVIYGCGGAAGEAAAGNPAAAIPELPVMTVDTASTITTRDYAAQLEGKVNVDIRTQVDGYLDKIFVDEGGFVKAGQPLFQVNDKPYREQLNKDIANLHAMQSSLAAATLNVEKVRPLVENKVVADMQLKTALAEQQTAKANVEQAEAAVAASRINLGFTLVKAPVSGFIGRIPKRVGNLVGKGDAAPLTTLSDISEVYAYFSMSENDFMDFSAGATGSNMEQQLKHMRPVSLILSNGNVYTHKGRIEMVDGQFNKTTAAISLRATFPNPASILRSGNTGKVRTSQDYQGALLIPQAATQELQDKFFVYVVGDSNIIKRQIIQIAGSVDNHFIVREGLKRGDKIVTAGIETLAEGTPIKPASGAPAKDTTGTQK
ncbi:efflux RND transporter periplasmic adaptor subunit [Chitinophaga nivalis]|uniref:Efflux RND transporter periplasmic adaptor subunit n=1 Tax=Chitinophaga nivalis TaxID=2991709 RepID=A0ABT3IGQ5_9BACT|nr:efflux RND transporter periplasmic adaptor subunit [Chitinophaga nivalis]MCW3467160.1 efflux RND transporter periplasmic adaptor subunit [Chitinophaga nivalis]MCW3483148.1 efflux RND transporter periplasmic adaptor subunit [Chitinophaga nivalis]